MNSLEAGSPRLASWLLKPQGPRLLLSFFPTTFNTLVQNGCTFSSYRVHVPAEGKEEEAKNVPPLHKDLSQTFTWQSPYLLLAGMETPGHS